MQMRASRGEPKFMPEMPPLPGGDYLVNYLFEIGPTMPAGMGSGPLTHTEIDAWQRNTGIVLHPWEARFLRRLSIEYLTSSSLAEKRDCEPPWEAPDATVKLETVGKSLQQTILEMSKL